MLLKLTELTKQGENPVDKDVFVNTDYIVAIHDSDLKKESAIDTPDGNHSTSSSVRVIEFTNGSAFVVRETFDEIENLL